MQMVKDFEVEVAHAWKQKETVSWYMAKACLLRLLPLWHYELQSEMELETGERSLVLHSEMGLEVAEMILVILCCATDI
jgi:hypothetical protein